jgi:hypothetical protein
MLSWRCASGSFVWNDKSERARPFRFENSRCQPSPTLFYSSPRNFPQDKLQQPVRRSFPSYPLLHSNLCSQIHPVSAPHPVPRRVEKKHRWNVAAANPHGRHLLALAWSQRVRLLVGLVLALPLLRRRNRPGYYWKECKKTK